MRLKSISTPSCMGFPFVVIGAGISFLVSGYLFSNHIHTKFGERPLFNALSDAIKEEGWKVVALMRFSPAVSALVYKTGFLA